MFKILNEAILLVFTITYNFPVKNYFIFSTVSIAFSLKQTKGIKKIAKKKKHGEILDTFTSFTIMDIVHLLHNQK